MQALPSGTVTFVFTDIEGSTELLKQLGSGYGDVLGTHRQIVRETFVAANGIEIDTKGMRGLDVVRAARICTAARGGNVLLSESTRALLGSTLP
nr:hypothetical protein [Actinomycetota bacterium]